MAISDRKLAELGRELQAHKAAIKAAEVEHKPFIESLTRRITAEMERRETRKLETGGTTLTYVRQEPVSYDVEKMRRVLRRFPEILERVLIYSVNKPALESEVEAGNVTPEQLVKFQTVTPSKPYITVS